MEDTISTQPIKPLFDIKDGISAGLLGASVVALFFIFTNVLAGHPPLQTPAVLGALVFEGPDALSNGIGGTWGHIAGYSALHFGAFIVLGLGMKALANFIAKIPAMGGFAILMLAIVEIPIIVLALTVGAKLALTLHVVEILAANILATVTMVGYFFARSEILHMTFSKGLWDHALNRRQRRRLTQWRRLENA